jgi:hypothetical protein
LTEGHFTYAILLLVFSRLFTTTTNNNIIQLKPAEFVPDESTSEKVYVYGDSSTSLIGFKIDIRFMFNFQNDEFDLCSLEAAREDPGGDKVNDNHSKLVREGKTNTVALIKTNGNAPGTHT